MAKRYGGSTRNAGSLLKSIAKYVPYILTALAVIVSYYFFINTSILLTFVCFIVLVPIFAFFKFNGRILFAFAVVTLLIGAAVLTSYSKEVLSNHFVIISYWLLVAGILILIIDYLRNRGK